MACDLSPLAVGILKFATVDLLTFMASQVASVHKSAAFISRAAASYAPTHGQHALAQIEADPRAIAPYHAALALVPSPHA